VGSSPHQPDGRVVLKDGETTKIRGYYTNFDYGLYENKSNTWRHANHSEPGMALYESSLQYYSRSLLDFNKGIFCCNNNGLKKIDIL